MIWVRKFVDICYFTQYKQRRIVSNTSYCYKESGRIFLLSPRLYFLRYFLNLRIESRLTGDKHQFYSHSVPSISEHSCLRMWTYQLSLLLAWVWSHGSCSSVWFSSWPVQFCALPTVIDPLSFYQVHNTLSRSASLTASSLSVFNLADATALVLNGFDNETSSCLSSDRYSYMCTIHMMIPLPPLRHYLQKHQCGQRIFQPYLGRSLSGIFQHLSFTIKNGYLQIALVKSGFSLERGKSPIHEPKREREFLSLTTTEILLHPAWQPK
jgi:hypothetical protein